MLRSVDASMVLDPMTVEVDEAARVFAVLADPARLRVLTVLADSQQCVCNIQSAAPMAANLLSYHLRTLREAGLVVGTRRGRFVDYRLTEAAAALIQGAVRSAGFDAAVEEPAGCAPGCEVPAR
jgi:ArsR family transcriptional regulator